jgi:hypothetical protein
MKTKNVEVAKRIFDKMVEMEAYMAEKFENMKDALIKHDTAKSVDILAELELLIYEYAGERGLCPDCLNELETQYYPARNYYEFDEYELKCMDCGWTV